MQRGVEDVVFNAVIIVICITAGDHSQEGDKGMASWHCLHTVTQTLHLVHSFPKVEKNIKPVVDAIHALVTCHFGRHDKHGGRSRVTRAELLPATAEDTL